MVDFPWLVFPGTNTADLLFHKESKLPRQQERCTVALRRTSYERRFGRCLTREFSYEIPDIFFDIFCGRMVLQMSG